MRTADQTSAAGRPTFVYRCPQDLAVTPTPLRRVMVIGSCLIQSFPRVIQHAAGIEADYLLFNNLSELPESPPQSAANYDFQVIQIPLRSVVPPGAYFRLAYDD